ncbi:MAG TPA: lipocalin family protein [Pseudobdellovibrionaceae bacterium]|nr:lipocalin family protein [Pseudobdellovibrionaceae bacterium]
MMGNQRQNPELSTYLKTTLSDRRGPRTLFIVKAIQLSVLSIIGLSAVSASASTIETLPHVDVARYVGRWFQIARNPLPFEGECACSQQTLTPTTIAGTVAVHNSCNDKTPLGPLREIRGTASVIDATNSKLSVDFGFPRKGEYWIIAVGTNYEYAVVTDSMGNSLYILSKTPQLDPQLEAEARAAAARQVDTSKLLVTDQNQCVYPPL